jgi:chromosome segregation ATPase
LRKEIQESQGKVERIDNEIEKIEENQGIFNLNHEELSENMSKFLEVASDIKSITKKTVELEGLISEKDFKIIKITEELDKIKDQAAESKKNSDCLPQNDSELFMENQELKEKLKNFEQEQISNTSYLIDVLEGLKSQLYKEKSGKSEGENLTGCEKIGIEEQKKKIRRLKEELKIAKKQLEMMKNSRIEEEGVEDSPMIEERLNPHKKCMIY